MTISDYLEQFAGRRIVDVKELTSAVPGVAYRLAQEYDEGGSQAELLESLLTKVPAEQIEALILGFWDRSYEDSPQEFLDALIERKFEFRYLRALFIGDMTYEECEISWIVQGDYSKLLSALPELEVLTIRGSSNLKLPPFEHHHLRELTIECGGLPREIVNNLSKSKLPALRKLELWLGDENYGFDGELADFQQLLSALDGSRLEYLGLCNAQISDELAQWLAGQAWIANLHTLDLSMGTLGDVGAQALLGSPYVKTIKHLNLAHHYISDQLQGKLKGLPCQVNLDDPQDEEDDERYVEVSE